MVLRDEREKGRERFYTVKEKKERGGGGRRPDQHHHCDRYRRPLPATTTATAITTPDLPSTDRHRDHQWRFSPSRLPRRPHTAKEQLKQSERKNRDEFRKMMEEHVVTGVKDSTRYQAVALNTSGSTPKDLIEDIAEELEKQEMKSRGIEEARLQLLQDVSGDFRPGVLTALVGVTGAGKTTLMDVLAGRKTAVIVNRMISILHMSLYMSPLCTLPDCAWLRMSIRKHDRCWNWLENAARDNKKTCIMPQPIHVVAITVNILMMLQTSSSVDADDDEDEDEEETGSEEEEEDRRIRTMIDDKCPVWACA
ncbi:hypothetical protein RHMOL_Rhmol09G0126400 [Rhododendron molle]|uniref:Uncharacterized protein n=1 Tax=Rhododendron molle TaxID=49168 RepID=A0ACC0MEI5_RHOML|nr:hypothetical protein RHMOL_Rhmol09G0126400 [Rhododendron molle]